MAPLGMPTGSPYVENNVERFVNVPVRFFARATDLSINVR